MPGQFYDAESSLFYNWNRYYNPATGRYISSDPIGLEGGINTFLYAAASPVMMVDPEGLEVFANDTIGPLRFGDIWKAQIPNFPDAQLFTAPDGRQFIAPRSADWCAIYKTGQKSGFNPFAGRSAIAHSGTFDFQRMGKKYRPEYIDASNFAVGVYMAGASFSDPLLNHALLQGAAGIYSFAFSSNKNDPKQSLWWDNGWVAARSGTLECVCRSISE